MVRVLIYNFLGISSDLDLQKFKISKKGLVTGCNITFELKKLNENIIN